MKQIISFDLWNTLIKSNPDHKQAQIQTYIDWFKNTLNIELPNSVINEIPEILRNVNKNYDQLTEFNPTYNFDHTIRLRTIVVEIQKFDHYLKNPNGVFHELEIPDEFEIDLLYQNLISVFVKYPPIPMYKDLPKDLGDLTEKYTLIINSNTGVMGNTIMMKVLEDIGLFHQFTAFNFSNVSEYAKPDVRSFEGGKRLPHLHVGDNDYADVIDTTAIVCYVQRNWSQLKFRSLFCNIDQIIERKINVINNSSSLDS